MSVETIIKELKKLRVVELGQYFEEGMPVHPSHPRFYSMSWHSLKRGDCCTDNQILLNEHSGTHVDSFGHYIDRAGYELIDEIPAERFCCPCVALNARFLTARQTLEASHIKAWEKEHGAIRRGDGVLLNTGWMDKWALFENGGGFCSGFPGLGESGAKYLREIGVNLVGIDTLSIDADGAKGDPAHNVLLGEKILVVENLRNLDALNDARGIFAMLPLLIRNGSASPVRPVVLIE